MNSGHLRRGGRADPDLVDGADEAPAEETGPGAKAKPVGGQFAEDIVHKLAALLRSRDGAASGEPADRSVWRADFDPSADHAGTIAVRGVSGVTEITFSAGDSRMMGSWPMSRKPLRTTLS